MIKTYMIKILLSALLLIPFIILIYEGFKTYIINNLGKEECTVNKFIYGSIIYATITTLIIAVLIYGYF